MYNLFLCFVNDQKCPCQHQSITLLIFDYLFIQRQKEQLHAKITQLEKQLDMKQKLELEILQLKGKLDVMKHMEDDGDSEVLYKLDALHKDLREKEQSLQDLDALNQTLIIKERKSNDELQEARKELINVSPPNKKRCIFCFQSADYLNYFVRASVQLEFFFLIFSYLNSWMSLEYSPSCFR